MQTGIYYINIKFYLKTKKAENYNNMFTFLHQTDKFIITGDMAAQTFWQWSDDIKP
jgi:hypothetical protein